ncbi:hypothetical protein, partial [Pseudomonas sp. 2995-1]|uniref:hypothetical protein n=1 Tax=Pseudomonas sp. 2995-1 TaxID=1712679 RepID=UPI001C48D5FE
AKLNLKTKVSEEVFKTDWHVVDLRFTHNHTYMILSINRDAHTDIKIIEAMSGEEITLPELPDGQVTSINFSLDEKLMTFLLN